MTGAQLDTVDALMAQYVAGILPAPAHALVAAHLEMKSVNRGKMRNYEVAAGDFLSTIDPVALTGRDMALSSIFGSSENLVREVPEEDGRPAGQLFPRAISELVGFEAEDIRWKTKLPGFKEHVVGKFDGCEVSFFWIRPGRTVPAHTHQGFELSLVLDGAFSDSRGRYGKGDISLADDSVDHRPVAEKQGPCIGFAVLDAPLKLTGSLRQLLGDLVG